MINKEIDRIRKFCEDKIKRVCEERKYHDWIVLGSEKEDLDKITIYLKCKNCGASAICSGVWEYK